MSQSVTISTNSGPVCENAQRHYAGAFGPMVLPDGKGVVFRLWAPSAEQVELVLLNGSDGQAERIPMIAQEEEGWFTHLAPEAGEGTLYKFRINGDLEVPDPASRYQPEGVHGPSMVVDSKRFVWQDTGWQGRPWQETVLYELHIGTFTPEGTFLAAIEKLDHLVDLGVTAIELMPVAAFPGERDWGYDGVLLYAPHHTYGTPDDLKKLIQAAHAKGLMVFLDVVYNHFGPEGNYLHAYAKGFFTEHYHTPWGAAINFEGDALENASPVRDFFIENALFWLNEYHFDGLRFDAVHAIYDKTSPPILRELVATVRQQLPSDRHVHLVLENDDNAASLTTPQEGEAVAWYDAQWNDDFHHAAHVIATTESGGYYEDYAAATSARSAIAHLGRCLTEGFAYQGEASPYRDGELRGEPSGHLPTTAFVNFLQNHDQIGNRAFGERLSTLAPAEALRALTTILLLAPSIPMLYMGEEWGSTTSFLFFCDFNEELAPLVTEGRRKEFARFPEFSKPETRERIPDPSSKQTSLDSCLNWDDLGKADHQDWLAFTRQLLMLRAQEIVPLIPEITSGHAGHHQYQLLGDGGLHARWELSGNRALYMTANLSSQPLTLGPDVHDNLTSAKLHRVNAISDSADSAIKKGQMPSWTVLWQVG